MPSTNPHILLGDFKKFPFTKALDQFKHNQECKGWTRMMGLEDELLQLLYWGPDLGKTSNQCGSSFSILSSTNTHWAGHIFHICFPQLSDIWYFRMLHRVFFVMFTCCLRLVLTSSSFDKCARVHSLAFLYVRPWQEEEKKRSHNEWRIRNDTLDV